MPATSAARCRSTSHCSPRPPACSRAVDPQNRIIQPEPVPFDPAGLDRRLQAPVGASWEVWGAYLPDCKDFSRRVLALSAMTTEVLSPGPARRPVWVVGASCELPADRWVQYYLLASAFGVARFYATENCLDRAWAPALSRLRYQGFLQLGPAVWALAFTDDSGPVVAVWSETDAALPVSALAPVAEARLLQASAALDGRPGAIVDARGPAPLVRLGPRPVLLRGLDIRAAHPGPPTRKDVLAARGSPDLSSLPAVSVDYNRSSPELGLYNRALRGLPGGNVREEVRSGRLAVGTNMRPDRRKPRRTAPGSTSTWMIPGSTSPAGASR